MESRRMSRELAFWLMDEVVGNRRGSNFGLTSVRFVNAEEISAGTNCWELLPAAVACGFSILLPRVVKE